MRFKFFICLIVLLLPFCATAKDITAIGFVEATDNQQSIRDKIRLAFVRTDSGWSSSCSPQIMSRPWQIIDADGERIDVGSLKLSKARYGGETGLVSIEKPLKTTLKFDSSRQYRYTWEGKENLPLLAVPKGTRVETISPTATEASVKKRIKDKLIKEYLRKMRTVAKCDSNENLISQRDALPKDIVIKQVIGYQDGLNFYNVSIPDSSGCGILDDGLELMAVKETDVVNLSESLWFLQYDHPTSTSLTLFNRYAVSTEKTKDSIFVFFVGGYNEDGYALFNSELTLKAISTWNYH